MRLLKAFVRMDVIDEVVRALQAAGAPGVTIAHVYGVGYDYDPELYTFAPGVEGRAPVLAEIDVVCRVGDADHLVDTIVRTAGSGRRGDGLVFVTPVERVVKIRTGGEGPDVLRA